MSYFGSGSFSNPSLSNFTVTPLGSSATYTGAGELNNFDGVTIDVRGDGEFTVYMDFSVDGSNWTSYPVVGFKGSSTQPVFRSAKKAARYFRLRIVNGSVAQTYLRAYTYYGPHTQIDAALNQSIALDSSAVVSRPTIAQDEIIRGLRGGVTYIGKFGYRDTTTAGAGEETLWYDNSNFVVMTSADTFTITYNNATDGLATTGALSLLVDYLDANFELQQAVHILGNTGSDVTSFSGLGINRAVVISSGTANTNTNNITFADTGATFGNQAVVPAGDGVTQQLVYHCPILSVPVMQYLELSTNKIAGGGNPRVTFRLKSYNRVTETQYNVRRFTIDTNSNTRIVYDKEILFSGRDVIFVTMDTDVNNTVGNGSFSINQYETV